MRIGFIVDNITEDYQRLIWKGIQKAASSFHVQIFTVPGRKILSGKTDEKAHNLLYNFLASDFFDGYIITATNFGSGSLTIEDVNHYFSQFKKPVISLGVKMGNETAVLIDNVSGLRDMINHLIRHHGYKKLGFIRGPVNNTEAEIRYRTFKKALEDNKLEFHEEWTAVGTFLGESGYKGMKEILEKKDRPEAVIAANDIMLLGGYKYVKELGLRVPEDIALAGFDDVPATRFNPVPVTTVKQPIEELAITSVKLLLEQLKSGVKSEDKTLLTKPVFRSSCGCLSSNVEFAGVSDDAGEEDVAEKKDMPVIDCIEMLLARQTTYTTETLHNKEHIETVWEHLSDYLKEPGVTAQTKYIHALSTALGEENGVLKSYHTWNSILSTFSMMIKRRYPGENSSHINSLIRQGYILISEKIDQIQEYNAFTQAETFASTESSLQRIMESYDLKSFIETLRKEIPLMKFKSFYLVLFDPEKVSEEGLPEEGQVRLWYRDGICDLPESMIFRTEEMLPQELLEKETGLNLIVQMITNNGIPTGLLICDCEDKPNDIYEAIRSQVSTSVRTGNLINSMKKSEDYLKERNKEIEEKILPMLDVIKEVDRITSDNRRAMEITENQIEKTGQTFSETSQSVETIAENAQNIIQLIKMIDDISEQINVLSINASIESARAGENGRGFGVIAGEIRKLADSTAKNAAQTNDALQTVVKNIAVSRKSSQNSMESYSTIQHDINSLSDSLDKIQSKMLTLSDFSRSIMDIINQ